ncbi:malate:quinone oxidoreductase, partial [Thalassolituus sp. UBA2590]|uniref:malate:quinone oxidoreductase n=1 Tax=Thalassolituus sp. UBA2590 TaxID=1947663 RepID=UPI0026479543
MTTEKVDVLLVGGGAMSATLGTLLRRLDPSLQITLVERLDHVAHESTDGWNNAGTGHAGYCELNYTPQTADGDVEIDRALSINANFEISLQLWSYLVREGGLPEPKNFINTTPHLSFVWGEDNVEFLRRRHEKLSAHHLFKEMEYSEDPAVLEQWMPLVMKDRDPSEKVAATRIAHGTDVDFGSLARNMVKNLQNDDNFTLCLNHEVNDFDHSKDGSWHVRVKDRKSGKSKTIQANFVFLGAGGGALPLLQASGIDEADGYGGFPVSGQWLV